jgi:hypothetical protein
LVVEDICQGANEMAMGWSVNGGDKWKHLNSEGQKHRLYLGSSAAEFMNCLLSFVALSILGT